MKKQFVSLLFASILLLGFSNFSFAADIDLEQSDTVGNFLIDEFNDPLPTFSLGDRVWYDQNMDGIQDPNEPGYNGVTVDLHDNATCSGTPVASTTTAAGPAGFGDGYYQFTDVPGGDYCLQFGNIPPDWIISPANQGDGTNDSSANSMARISSIRLKADNPNEDMGIYVPGSLGDNVICISTGEGLANISVTLYEDFDGDGTVDGPAIATTETDPTGFYEFTGLEVALAGDPNNLTQYIVVVDTNDADLGTCNIPIPPVVYNPPLDSDNPDDPDNDFQFEKPAATIDKTWSLFFSEVCEPVLEKTADVDSVDATSGRATLNYTIQVDHVDTQFINAEISDVTIANSSAAPITVDVVDTLYCDAGGGVPGDLVTEAFSESGITLSPNEGVSIPGGSFDVSVCGDAGVVNRVEVFQAGTGALIAAQNFSDPPAAGLGCALGIDQLEDVETLPAGYSIDLNSIAVTRNGQPIDPLAVGPGNPFTLVLDYVDNVTTATYTLQKDVVRDDGLACEPAVVDNVASTFGLFSSDQIDLTCQTLLTLGDRVWYDQDQNGIQDPNEPGYNGASVDLYDNATCSGTPMASTTTTSGPGGFGDGFYQFTDLAAGDYCLQFGNIPAGWDISPADQGDGTNDSSANSSAQIPNISLTADDPDEDMGIYIPGSLGDTVICVSTGDGLANIAVSLFEDFNGDGVSDGPAIGTTETDASGFYEFTGLEVALAGDPNNLTQYIVAVDTNDADLGTCNIPIPPVVYNPPLDSDNPDDPNNDFFFTEPSATVGDRVWFDDNADGVQDPGEAGIPDVTVNLTDCNGNSLATDVTDGNGNYLFDGLAPGTYCVVIDQTTLPPDVVQTFEKDGTLDGDTQQPLTAGDVILDVDFGYVFLVISLEKYTRVDPGQSTGDLCDTYDKPQTLTMIYTGDNVNDNDQDPSKVDITGDPMFATPVHIIASEDEDGDGKVYFDGNVNLGDAFVIDAQLAGDDELRSATWVTIYDLNGNVLQSIEFHTSCSQPLSLGDQFGGIQLVGFMDENGNGEDLPPPGLGEDADTPTGPTAVVGDTIVWTYIVTNPGGPALADINVMDDAGTPGDPSDDFAAAAVADGGVNVGDANADGLLDMGEAWQFTASGIALLGQYGNLAVASGTAVGVTVSDDDPSHYFGEYTGEDLCDSYGKPQILTMLYTGDNINDNDQDPSKVNISGDPMFATPVYIIASEDEDGGGKIYFEGTVNLGESFVIDARLAGDDELKSKTFVTVYDLNGNVLQAIEFHTSCSQPLALGDQFGSIQLVGFQDKNGGGEGEIPPGAEVRTDLCDTYGKPQLLTMLYTGDNINDNFQDPSKVEIVGDPMFAGQVLIIASEDEDGGGKIYFDGLVTLGEAFAIDAQLAGDNELKSKTFVTIYDLNDNVLQAIEFHTSCSQPLTIDDQFGGIQLVGFVDKDGDGP